jgi:type 1 fimbria pilin
MKKYISTMVLAGLFCGAQFPAMAADTADLQVTGSIIPSACTPTLSKDALDLGNIKYQDLSPTVATSLPEVQATLRVQCDGPQVTAVKMTDNRKGSAYVWLSSDPDADNGLGFASDGTTKLGGYEVQARGSNATRDGAPATLLEGTDDAEWVAIDEGGNVYLEPAASITVSGPTPATPAAATEWTVDLGVIAHIAPRVDLSLTEDASLDGSVTFSLVYL